MSNCYANTYIFRVRIFTLRMYPYGIRLRVYSRYSYMSIPKYTLYYEYTRMLVAESLGTYEYSNLVLVSHTNQPHCQPKQNTYLSSSIAARHLAARNVPIHNTCIMPNCQCVVRNLAGCVVNLLLRKSLSKHEYR